MSDLTLLSLATQKPKQLYQLQPIKRTQQHSDITEQFFCFWNHCNYLYYKKHLLKNMFRKEIISFPKTIVVDIENLNCKGKGVRSPADTIKRD
jgi:hypothetical protein